MQSDTIKRTPSAVRYETVNIEPPWDLLNIPETPGFKASECKTNLQPRSLDIKFAEINENTS